MALLGMEFDEGGWAGITTINGNGTYSGGDLSKYKEFLFVLVLQKSRQSLLIPDAYVRADGCFPDFTIGTNRLYFDVVISGNNLVVTNYTNNISVNAVPVAVFGK